MPRKTKKTKYSTELAFTIIEVVLVLAIAGLIFAMVFIGLPMLQRSQRNAQRRRDVDRVYAAVVEYKSHNNNRLPVRNFYFDYNFISRYVDENCEFSPQAGSDNANYEGCGEEFTDPDGTIYSVHADASINTGYKGNAKAVLASSTKGASPLTQLATSGGAYDEEGYEDVPIVFDHVIYILAGFRCANIEGKIYNTGRPNDFVVGMHLEGGMSYCKDDNDPAESNRPSSEYEQNRLQNIGPIKHFM